MHSNKTVIEIHPHVDFTHWMQFGSTPKMTTNTTASNAVNDVDDIIIDTQPTSIPLNEDISNNNNLEEGVKDEEDLCLSCLLIFCCARRKRRTRRRADYDDCCLFVNCNECCKECDCGQCCDGCCDCGECNCGECNCGECNCGDWLWLRWLNQSLSTIIKPRWLQDNDILQLIIVSLFWKHIFIWMPYFYITFICFLGFILLFFYCYTIYKQLLSMHSFKSKCIHFNIYSYAFFFKGLIIGLHFYKSTFY